MKLHLLPIALLAVALTGCSRTKVENVDPRHRAVDVFLPAVQTAEPQEHVKRKLEARLAHPAAGLDEHAAVRHAKRSVMARQT